MTPAATSPPSGGAPACGRARVLFSLVSRGRAALAGGWVFVAAGRPPRGRLPAFFVWQPGDAVDDLHCPGACTKL
ncbi:MAG: hypothetical protein J3K34DRAFT_442737 [Monoraphidium minutum]|nr:MAG: hypothetical protein J3K34DRAFT_442737 [Monoraphidium minutum]